MPADLAAVHSRLRSILSPYAATLEATRKEAREVRIWNRRALSSPIVWLVLALVLTACGNGGKPGY
ncbi:MAG TPA: hypothetical protein VEX41_10225 [Candidatus Eisenbacteria bacterium]|nr:hypothetical protein [Candidatus Eisenbacteria bacterium]